MQFRVHKINVDVIWGPMDQPCNCFFLNHYYCSDSYEIGWTKVNVDFTRGVTGSIYISFWVHLDQCSYDKGFN